MQTAMELSIAAAPVSTRIACRRASAGPVFGLKPLHRVRAARGLPVVCAAEPPQQVIVPLNNDPFIGMLETPVTSSPLVATFLSNLPAYRTGVSPLLRGVEIGLAHGYLVTGPFIKFGPLRNVPEVAEKAGCLASAGVVLILTLALVAYGAVTFQQEAPVIGVKTLSGREIPRDPLQSAAGWNAFSAGWLVGGLSGVAWAYILTLVLPYYS
eukprot:jgi/Botrbrau1/20105/Bobra.0173s0008.1